MGLHYRWCLKTRSLELGSPTYYLGVLNITPDSFSDGSRWMQPDAAIAHALEMLDAGADVIDIGGESTRPGAVPVPPDEEQSRVVPVIRGILRVRPEAVLSIDTYHADTARKALEAGVEIVNDVSGGLWDRGMREVWAESRCGVILMHTRGTPQEWGKQPLLKLNEVVPLVTRELRTRAEEALAAGVSREAIVLDPGFGFGKIGQENVPLLAGIAEICGLGFPVAVGLSRKGFLRRIMEAIEVGVVAGDSEAVRDATLAANTAAILGGVQVLRVHDVVGARRAGRVAEALLAFS